MGTTKEGIGANTKYKDTVFRKLFGENKENALSLYNAINIIYGHGIIRIYNIGRCHIHEI